MFLIIGMLIVKLYSSLAVTNNNMSNPPAPPTILNRKSELLLCNKYGNRTQGIFD